MRIPIPTPYLKILLQFLNVVTAYFKVVKCHLQGIKFIICQCLADQNLVGTRRMGTYQVFQRYNNITNKCVVDEYVCIK